MTLSEAQALLPRYTKLGLNVKLTGIAKISGRPEIRNYLTVEQIKADKLENADFEYFVSIGDGDYHSIEQQNDYFEEASIASIVALFAQFNPGFSYAKYYGDLLGVPSIAEAVQNAIKAL
jgi:hypothetical protein